MKSRTWLWPVAVAAITFACFSSALSHGWIDHWDDDRNFLENEHYRGLGWENVKWAFTTYHTGPYQPLSWMSLSLDHALWGMDARGYHLTNVALHSANAALMFFLLLALLRGTGTHVPARRTLAAAAGALFFSIHPLRVESVAWVTERRDVLSGLFFLLTLLFYVRARDHRTATERRNRAYWAAVICYACSLLAKAAGMMLPFAMLVLDAYPLRRLQFDGLRVRGVRAVLLDKLPFVLLSAWIAYQALLGQQEAKTLVALAHHGLASRVMQALYGLCFYPLLTAYPVGLSPVYELGRMYAWEARFLVSAAVAFGVTVLLFVRRRAWPAPFTAWLVFAILAAPILGFSQAGAQIAADRYSYLPCLPFAALFAVAVRRWRVAGIVAAVALLVLAALTFQQTKHWKDARTLWTYAYELDANNYLVRFQLGKTLVEEGFPDEAEVHLEFSLRGRPHVAEAWSDLGVIHARRGQLDAAILYWRQALSLDPQLEVARRNLERALDAR